MDFNVYVDEFEADWRLSGHAPATGRTYGRYIRQLAVTVEGPVTLMATKAWLAESVSAETARARGRAVRAFGKWAENHDGPDWTWWPQVPLAAVVAKPQPTVTNEDYAAALRAAPTPRDELVVELLWCTGMRVGELAALNTVDVNLDDGFAVVRKSKTGHPRLVPLSDRACRMIRRRTHASGQLLGMSAHAIQLMLRRIGAPSAHAWRRGWAVQALRNGVSQTSVQAAAGWSSGAMVTRYTAAVSAELAISEFRRHGPGNSTSADRVRSD